MSGYDEQMDKIRNHMIAHNNLTVCCAQLTGKAKPIYGHGNEVVEYVISAEEYDQMVANLAAINTAKLVVDGM